MIPHLQARDEHIYLLCACAGPIKPYELPYELFCEFRGRMVQLEEEGVLTELRHGYMLRHPIRLSELQPLVTPEMQLELDALEEDRKQWASTGVASLRGRARQALARKQTDCFFEFLQRYGGDDQVGWHPDRHRYDFWLEVMGPDLLDSHILPPSKARNELIYQVLKRYCLRDLPENMAKASEPLEPSDIIGLAYQYYKARDGKRLAQLEAANKSLLFVRALTLMYRDAYDEAFNLFYQGLGSNLQSSLVFEYKKIDFLWPIAIQSALLAGAPRALTHLWVTSAQRCLLPVLKNQESVYEQAKEKLQKLFDATKKRKPPPASRKGGKGKAKKALFWDVSIDRQENRIYKIEARLLSPAYAELHKGRLLSFKKMIQGDYKRYCDKADKRLLPYVQELEYSFPPQWYMGLDGLEAVSQHPRLRLVGKGDKRRHMQLALSHNPRHTAYRLQAQEDGSFLIRLPKIKSSPPAKLSISLCFNSRVLHLQFLSKSQEDIEAVKKRFPILLRGVDKGNRIWHYMPLSLAFSVVEQLQKSEIPLLWQGSKPLYLHSPDKIKIHLRSDLGENSLLSLGVELHVNEELIYSTGEVMKAWENRASHFVYMGNLVYLSLGPKQMEQLQFLHSVLVNQQRNYRIHRSNLLLLVQIWAGQEEQLAGKLKQLAYQLQGVMENEAQLPSQVKADLRPYQKEGFRWLVSRAQCGLGMCLADEMGLGKTLQVLALLQYKAKDGVSLVVAPLSLIGNWARESARFCPELRVHVLSTRRQDVLPLKPGCVILASYGQVRSRPELQSLEWNLLVLDEAQTIKNPGSQRNRCLQQIKAQSRVALSATPMENNLIELWSLMNFLNPGMLGKKPLYSDPTQSPEVRTKMRQLITPVMLRRRKQDVLQELPALTEVVYGFELSEAERALYESQRRATLEILESVESNQIHILSQLTRLRRLCCHAGLVVKGFSQSSKLDALVSLARDLREGGHRALIFSQFTDVLKLAMERLQSELEGRCLYLDGRCSAKKRNQLVQDFQEGEGEDAADFFFISLKAGGNGLNLTGADYVILLDPWWNPVVEDQAMGRAHRIGQHKPVTMCRLICYDSVEERVLDLHRRKRDLASSLEELPQAELKGLITAELKGILQN